MIDELQTNKETMNPLLLLLLLLSVFSLSTAKTSPIIGINYGQLGNNLPTPTQTLQLLKILKPNFIKLYDANPQILTSLSTTTLQVSIMLPNEQITNISTSQTSSDQWVQSNLLPFHHKTNIRYILIGNEILSSTQDPNLWPHLVPAMVNINKSLKKFKILNVKVSTPSAMDVLESSFPPSNGTFRTDISDSVVKPLLGFLSRTKSSFFLDAYPYFPWSGNPNEINLDYALFNGEKENITYTDPLTKLTYTNLLDQMIDAVAFAMKRLGFPEMKIVLAETGWPTAGDRDEIGANIYNAATYNRNLVKRFTAKPVIGTPARPGLVIPVIVFALFNENEKPGPGTERNWGLFYPNGTQVYKIKLTRKQLVFKDRVPGTGDGDL